MKDYLYLCSWLASCSYRKFRVGHQGADNRWVPFLRWLMPWWPQGAPSPASEWTRYVGYYCEVVSPVSEVVSMVAGVSTSLCRGRVQLKVVENGVCLGFYRHG